MVHPVRHQRPSGRKGIAVLFRKITFRKEGSSCASQENNSGSKAARRKARIYQESVNFCEGSGSKYFRFCEPSRLCLHDLLLWRYKSNHRQ